MVFDMLTSLCLCNNYGGFNCSSLGYLIITINWEYNIHREEECLQQQQTHNSHPPLFPPQHQKQHQTGPLQTHSMTPNFSNRIISSSMAASATLPS